MHPCFHGTRATTSLFARASPCRPQQLLPLPLPCPPREPSTTLSLPHPTGRLLHPASHRLQPASRPPEAASAQTCRRRRPCPSDASTSSSASLPSARLISRRCCPSLADAASSSSASLPSARFHKLKPLFLYLPILSFPSELLSFPSPSTSISTSQSHCLPCPSPSRSPPVSQPVPHPERLRSAVPETLASSIRWRPSLQFLKPVPPPLLIPPPRRTTAPVPPDLPPIDLDLELRTIFLLPFPSSSHHRQHLLPYQTSKRFLYYCTGTL